MKDPIVDSDEALCFFLVDGYFSIFNKVKRYTTFIIFLFILFLMTYVNNIVMWSEEYDRFNYGFFNPITFMVSKVTVAILLILKVNDDLTPPAIRISYDMYSKRVAGDRTMFAQLYNMTSTAKDITEIEGLKVMTLFDSGNSLERVASNMKKQTSKKKYPETSARTSDEIEVSVASAD